MCDTIQQLDEKNDEAHNLFFKKLDKLEGSISKMSEDLTKVITDTAVNGTKVTNTVDTNKHLRWFIGLVVLLGMSFVGWKQAQSTSYQRQNLEINKSAADARVAAFILVDSINTRLKESNAVAKNFDAKMIIDTLNAHGKAERTFYTQVYATDRKAYWDVYKTKILPTEQRSKRNELILKDHEKRISKLEREERKD